MSLSKELRAIGLLTIIVSELVGWPIIGIGLGYLAYKKWDFIWAIPLTALFGFILAFYRVFKTSQKEL